METALRIRQQAEEKRSAMKELMDWEDSLKGKQKPVTPPVVEKNVKKPSQPRIKSYDYDKWDQFNVEEAIEEIDYSAQEPATGIRLEKPIQIEESLFEKEKGNEYFKRGKFKKAIQCYSKSADLDYTSAIPLVNRCFAFIKLER